ncbi:hypothetical protein GCK72_016697 [Caenorhabditis remanei]|uniref:SXP/RAL-2 family protein Ani s 5-like cation-binding domain-containing protein n=1 Tax=Caenorhabditis remanei TaxID=31234 RepID=A0A6A5G5B5_CAERE|nr:hypothetical protein GCK72_016697 [Caenorhabditis remanei]KAF1750150.1 hypothetical protein GCK72_016697 [Caenorhabditis remanei]
MFKVLFALSALTLAVYSAPPRFPNAAEDRAEMAAAGISAQAADGILKIANEFGAKKLTKKEENDREAVRSVFHQFLDQVDKYIKTQSPADQAAYEAFIAKKKANFDANIAAGRIEEIDK